MATETEHLSELLDLKNDKIEELQEEIYKLEDELRRYKHSNWFMHKTLSHKQILPVPRLEIEVVQNPNDEYEREWFYNLVYNHFLNNVRAVPLGHTKVSGGNFNPDTLSINDLPIRDGAHIKHDKNELKLPAFIICGDNFIEL